MATPPTVDSRSQFTLVLTQAPEVEGGQVMVTPEAFVGPGVTPAAVEQAQATADAAASAAAAAQDDATQALADAAVVWVPAVFTHNITSVSPATVAVPAPVTGTLASIMTSATAQPSATVTLTCSIGGSPVTGGAVSVTSSTPADSVVSSTATANNAVTMGTTAVLVTATTAANGNFRLVLLLGFRRA